MLKTSKVALWRSSIAGVNKVALPYDYGNPAAQLENSGWPRPVGWEYCVLLWRMKQAHPKKRPRSQTH